VWQLEKNVAQPLKPQPPGLKVNYRQKTSAGCELCQLHWGKSFRAGDSGYL